MPTKNQRLTIFSPTTRVLKTPLALSVLALCSTLGFSMTAQADEQNCSGTVPSFSASTGKVCLPVVEMTTPSGSLYYQAQLQLIPSSEALRFTLTSAIEIKSSGSSNPLFSSTTGLLTIPVVEQYELFGTNRYSVQLQLLPNTSPAVFELTPSVAAVISANYAPGKTWKPYVGLLIPEKEALNVLGDAQQYTPLAVAAYDFGIKTAGAWDLKDYTDLGSGMQAGVYINRDSNEIAIAFRGTEFCIIPFVCSLSALNESKKDVYTDTILTQGHDSGQFDDAYKYTQKIINTYPGRNITVTGHSLGGGLAQAAGASFQLKTYAFNSSPVPNNFFNDHGVKQFNSAFANIIHVISDIHDPVSNTDYSGKLYADASHVTPALFFDFDKKEIIPTYKATLDSVRFNKHVMDTLRDNISAAMLIYKAGW